MKKSIVSFFYAPKRKIDEGKFAVFYKKKFPDVAFGDYHLFMNFNNSLSYILKIESNFPLREERNKKDLKEIIKRIVSKENNFLPNRARVNDLRDYWRIQEIIKQANDELVIFGDTLESSNMFFKYNPKI